MRRELKTVLSELGGLRAPQEGSKPFKGRRDGL